MLWFFNALFDMIGLIAMTGQDTRHLTNSNPSETSTQESDAKALVLVVDGDSRILSFIRPSLRLAGYRVITTTSGDEALKLIDAEKPDVILLDILMSPMDGFEVLKRLRTFSQLPVIAVSDHTSVVEKALSLGADDFLGKPFRPDELFKRIKDVLIHKG
jgi:two-component system KDP operon response regulator KdpE